MAVWFSMRRVVTTLLFSMRMARLSRLARGRAPKGRRGLTPTGTTPDVSTDNINESEKERKVTLAMGNPSGPAGHLPYKAEEFCLRTDKLFAAADFKRGRRQGKSYAFSHYCVCL